MKLYNTQSQVVEPFIPRDHEVTIYVCGITPYDTTHIGHAFVYTITDVLVRYLEFRDLKVKYAQNVTDIDDDILRRANATGEDWRALGDRWTIHFIEDMQRLNVLPPDFYMRATQSIPKMVKNVQELLRRGVAYEAGGNVYYSIAAWPAFGSLSHLPREQMLPIANERGNFPDDPNKRDPLDFVLWQAQKPGEPAWPSPWGEGRPGWHIECSTMSMDALGDVIDIHGGGADLCFPHHECEIAQYAPIHPDKPFVRYWMHTAMVGYKGEKMSKSLGNLVMVRDLLQAHTPDAVRVLLGEHHYRQPWEYKDKDIEKAQKRADKLKQAAEALSGNGAPLESQTAHIASFITAMDDDLNTPRGLEVIESLADDIIEAAQGSRDINQASGIFRQLAHVFGFQLDASVPEKRVLNGWNIIREGFSTSAESLHAPG